VKKRIKWVAGISALALASTALAVTLTFDDSYDGRTTLGSSYTTVCVNSTSGNGCSQTDWSLKPWTSGQTCGTGAANCYLSPHQAEYADYNRSAALVNATDGSPTSHLEVSADITGEENPDDSDSPEGECVDNTKGQNCYDNMNAGLVLNSTSGTNLDNFVACKIEVNADGEAGSRPRGLINISDWQRPSGQNVHTNSRITDYTSFLSPNPPLLVNGTTYHLVFYRVADSNTYGTYYCTVSGGNLTNPVTVSWIATGNGTDPFTPNEGTFAGARAKVANNSTDHEDSGATRFDTFQYKVH